VHNEVTVPGERAVCPEIAATSERADHLETSAVSERAVRTDIATGAERAVCAETSPASLSEPRAWSEDRLAGAHKTMTGRDTGWQ
jgi:hypothetical protein